MIVFKKNVYDYPECCMSKNTVGCALSHLSIYQEMIDNDVKLALILEDDAIIDDRLKNVLNSLEYN